MTGKTSTAIAALTPDHIDALIALFARMPVGDLTFVKEDVTDPDEVRRWIAHPSGQWVAVDDGTVTGYVAVRRLPAWSDHVGEVRLVVDPERRRAGIGRALARHAVTESVGAGCRKLVVELAADQQHSIALFSSLGFTGEALLRNHIRDRAGNLGDLIMLAHDVDTNWDAMTGIGVTDYLEGTPR